MLAAELSRLSSIVGYLGCGNQHQYIHSEIVGKTRVLLVSLSDALCIGRFLLDRTNSERQMSLIRTNIYYLKTLQTKSATLICLFYYTYYCRYYAINSM